MEKEVAMLDLHRVVALHGADAFTLASASSWYSPSEDILRITGVKVQSVVFFTKQELKTFLDPAAPQFDPKPTENGTRVGDISLFVIRKVVTVAVAINWWVIVKRVAA